MTCCHYPLNFPGVDLNLAYTTVHMLEIDLADLLAKNSIIRDLNELFPIKRAALYCSTKFEVHSDGYYDSEGRHPARCGVNYIISGKGALKWYEPGIQTEDRHGTFIYSGYKKEIDSWEHSAGHWALVNAEIPHSPMVYEAPRAVISFRNKDISFSEARRRLRSWINDSSFIVAPEAQTYIPF